MTVSSSDCSSDTSSQLSAAGAEGLGQRLHRRRWALMAMMGMSGVYFWAYFQRVAVPGTIFNQLQIDFHLSASAVTGLGSILLYIYACAQLFVGLAADRYGGAKVLLIGGLLMGIGAVAFPLSGSVTMLYASRALVGLGTSFIFLAAVKEVDALFGHRHFPVMVGALMMMGNLGGMAATWPLERAEVWMGWRWAMLGAGVLTLAALGIAYGTLRQVRELVSPGGGSGKNPGEKAGSWRSLLGVVTNRRIYPMIACGALNFSNFFVLQSVVGKKLLEDSAGFSPSMAAGFTLILSVGTILVNLTVGWISWGIGHRRKPILMVAYSMTLVSTLLLVAGVTFQFYPVIFLVAFVLVALSNGSTPVNLAVAKEVSRPDSAALAVALINSAVYIAVAVCSNLAGLILDWFGSDAVVTATGRRYPPQAYLAVTLVMAALAGVSLLISWRTPETHGRSIHATTVPQEAT